MGSSLGQHLNCVLVCLPVRKVWKNIYTEWGLGVQICEAAAAAPEYSDPSVGIGGPDFQCCPPFSWLYHIRPIAAAVHTKPAWPSLTAYITPEAPPYGFDLVRPFLSLAPPWHIGGRLASVFLAFLLRPLNVLCGVGSSAVCCFRGFHRAARSHPTALSSWKELGASSAGMCGPLICFLLLAPIWTERKAAIICKWLQAVSVPFSKKPLQCMLQKLILTV